MEQVTAAGLQPYRTVDTQVEPAQSGFGAVLLQQLAVPASTVTTASTAGLPSVTLGEMLQIQAGSALPAPAVTLPEPVAPATAVPAPAPAAADEGPYLRPVDGPVTSSFGTRVHPITGEHRLHAGTDFGVPEGTPIRAAASGVVEFAGWDDGYGNYVIVRHADGSETRYAHQSRMDVQVGDRVQRGEVIGAVGSTGLSTGPHLHFEVRIDGEPVDPQTLWS